jgi:hypothetical protein
VTEVTAKAKSPATTARTLEFRVSSPVVNAEKFIRQNVKSAYILTIKQGRVLILLLLANIFEF